MNSRVIRLTSTVLHLTKALLESLNLQLELSHALVKHFEYFAIVFVDGSSLVGGSVVREAMKRRSGDSVDVVLSACERLVRSSGVNGSLNRSSGVDRSMNRSIVRGAGCDRISGSHLVYCPRSIL
jgi:hypothetical protein